jgi:hypothetical protein
MTLFPEIGQAVKLDVETSEGLTTTQAANAVSRSLTDVRWRWWMRQTIWSKRPIHCRLAGGAARHIVAEVLFPSRLLLVCLDRFD